MKGLALFCPKNCWEYNKYQYAVVEFKKLKLKKSANTTSLFLGRFTRSNFMMSRENSEICQFVNFMDIFI